MTHAGKPTPPNGESLTGESYPQCCICCGTEWTHLGDLSLERSQCSECGQERQVKTFFKWWIIENLETEISVRVRVPSELSAAADEIARVNNRSRREELIDLVSLKPAFLEERDRRE